MQACGRAIEALRAEVTVFIWMTRVCVQKEPMRMLLQRATDFKHSSSPPLFLHSLPL